MNKRMKIKLPEEWQIELELQAESLGISVEDYVVQIIEEWASREQEEEKLSSLPSQTKH